MEVLTIPEYERDMKRYVKRFRTLEADIDEVINIIRKKPDQRPPFSHRIDGLGIRTCVIKVKKIACRSMKGKGLNSGLRLVYAHFEKEERIVLVEVYHKSDKDIEDRERILRNFK